MLINFCVHGQEKIEKLVSPEINYWGKWKVGVGGNTYSDLTDSETSASGSLDILGGINLTNWLNLKADVSVVGRSGYSQQRFGRDTLESGININESIIELKPISFFKLDAGIINQSFLNSPLLISSRPFPGLRETLMFENNIFKAQLIAQQAIATSRSLDTNRSQKEETPRFDSQTFNLSFEPFKKSTEISLSASRFKFGKLPSSVADTSRTLGNTVPFSSPAQSEFAFDYKGFLYSLSGKQKINKNFKLDAQAQLLKNTQAASALSRGFLAEVGGSFYFDDHHLRLAMNNFFNEADSSPAYYNSSSLGHNNVKGNSYLAAFTYRNLFTLNIGYTESEVITPNLVNTNRENLQISLETQYVDF